MIDNALAGVYDDFLSDLDFPIRAMLCSPCSLHFWTSVLYLAMDGEFDTTKEEAVAWAASPEGKSMLKDMAALGKMINPPKK